MPNDNDTTPLLILAPRREPPAGASTIEVDLGHFFSLLGRIGRDPALLLLTIRATRVRMWSMYGLHELAWMLRARHRDVRAWLDTLSDARLVDYHVTAQFGRDAMALEILGEPVVPPPPTAAPWPPASTRRIEHALPSFWFVTVLPRIGRIPFLLYLHLLRAEAAEFAVAHPRVIAEALQLPSARHSLRHLRRLRQHGLVRRQDGGQSLVVLDPPPPTKWQRLVLRMVEFGLWPRVLAEFLVGLVLLAILAALVLLQPSH